MHVENDVVGTVENGFDSRPAAVGGARLSGVGIVQQRVSATRYRYDQRNMTGWRSTTRGNHDRTLIGEPLRLLDRWQANPTPCDRLITFQPRAHAVGGTVRRDGNLGGEQPCRVINEHGTERTGALPHITFS